MKNPFFLFLFWLFLFFSEQQKSAQILFVPGVSFVILTYVLFCLEGQKIIFLTLAVFFIRAVYCSSSLLIVVEFLAFLILRFFLTFSQGRKILMGAIFSLLAVYLSRLLFLFLSPEHQVFMTEFNLSSSLNLFLSNLLFLWILNGPAAVFEERFFSLGSKKSQLHLFEARKLRKPKPRRRFGLKKDW